MGGNVSDSNRNDFEEAAFQSMSNPLVSDVLETVSEDVILGSILPFLDRADFFVLSNVCKYFNDVYHKQIKEIRISLRVRDRKYLERRDREKKKQNYEYTEKEKDYIKELEKTLKPVKKFENLNSLVLVGKGAFYGLYHCKKIFSRFPIKKLDISKTGLFFTTTQFSFQSNDPERLTCKDMLKKILLSVSDTLEYLDMSNFQGDGDNVFLKECFEACKNLNFLIIGRREELDCVPSMPDFLDYTDEQREANSHKLNTYNYTLIFTFCTHSRYRPKLSMSIFDPLLHPDRIKKMKGLILNDCGLIPKIYILSKLLQQGGPEQGGKSKLKEIGLIDRFLPEKVIFEKDIPSVHDNVLKSLRRVSIWDPKNVFRFGEKCFMLKEFEGQLEDDQIKMLAENNHGTLQRITLFEIYDQDHPKLRRRANQEVDKRKKNSDTGLKPLKKCKLLRYMKFIMAVGGERFVLKSVFSEDFMVHRKEIIPERYKSFPILSQPIPVGHFGSPTGKVWTSSLKFRDVFYFFWQCEKENYSHSYNKNSEI